MFKIVRILTKPVSNKKALSSAKVIIIGLVMMFITGLGMYIAANNLHNSVSTRMDSVASSLLDSVIENRELTPAMQEYFKKELNKLNFYNTDYKITYKKITFTGGTFNSTTLGVSDNGASIGTFTFEPGDLIHIDIESSEDNMLSRVSNVILGEESKVTTLGSAEGCVK